MNEVVSSLDSVKKCPICGGELGKGYVQVSWMRWDNREAHVGAQRRFVVEIPSMDKYELPRVTLLEMSHHDIRLRKERISMKEDLKKEYSRNREPTSRVKVNGWKETVGITLPQDLVERARNH